MALIIDRAQAEKIKAGAKEALEGTYQTYRHPIESAKTMIEALRNPRATAKAAIEEARARPVEFLSSLVTPVPDPLRMVKGKKAYHGSPHDFEVPDVAHLGSGENTLMEGPGFYMGSHPYQTVPYIGLDKEKIGDRGYFYEFEIPNESLARYVEVSKPLTSQRTEVTAALRRAYPDTPLEELDRRLVREGGYRSDNLAEIDRKDLFEDPNLSAEDLQKHREILNKWREAGLHGAETRGDSGQFITSFYPEALRLKKKKEVVFRENPGWSVEGLLGMDMITEDWARELNQRHAKFLRTGRWHFDDETLLDDLRTSKDAAEFKHELRNQVDPKVVARLLRKHKGEIGTKYDEYMRRQLGLGFISNVHPDKLVEFARANGLPVDPEVLKYATKK